MSGTPRIDIDPEYTKGTISTEEATSVETAAPVKPAVKAAIHAAPEVDEEAYGGRRPYRRVITSRILQ